MKKELLFFLLNFRSAPLLPALENTTQTAGQTPKAAQMRVRLTLCFLT
jgi:hypothetical protein